MVEPIGNDHLFIFLRPERRYDAPSSCNRGEIGLGYPGIPVILQDVQSGGFILELSKGKFIDYPRVPCVVK